MRMFPISSKQPLSFTKIASYWSREIKPRPTFYEVLNELGKAWWRGELMGASGSRRADVLRAIFVTGGADFVAFFVPKSDEKTSIKDLPDGRVEIRPWRVSLPNSQPESWDDINCAEAFNAVAEAWDLDRFSLAAPVVAGLRLTEPEFRAWVDSKGYPPPTFWQSGGESLAGDAGRQVSKLSAIKLVQDYIAAESEAGRQPTQVGLENKLREDGWSGGREYLRDAFKKIQLAAGIEVRAGRPKGN
jgi:hypothetical protein